MAMEITEENLQEQVYIHKDMVHRLKDLRDMEMIQRRAIAEFIVGSEVGKKKIRVGDDMVEANLPTKLKLQKDNISKIRELLSDEDFADTVTLQATIKKGGFNKLGKDDKRSLSKYVSSNPSTPSIKITEVEEHNK